MEFRLLYRGELKSNRGRIEKQAIRRFIHRQLAILWNQLPLLDYKNFLEPKKKDKDICLLYPLGKFQFVPLINYRLSLTAEIDVLLLRPEEPGSVMMQSGDIDNRLKTLLDALRMPKVTSEIPQDDEPGESEIPFYCLLEDDKLITHLSVTTDRLLDEQAGTSYVDMVIHVKTKTTRVTFANIGFA